MKLALIGCGKWGRHYLKTLTSLEDCELRWVCDSDPQKLKDAVAAYPQIKGTENKADILNDNSVQGVVIATTPESHYLLAKEFIGRGKSVLVEKPVTIDHKDSMDLIHLAAAQNRVLMAGYTLIYHPAVKKIKRFLEENKMSDHLCYLNMSRTNSAPQVSGVDVLHDLAVHDIYLSRHLTGEDPVWVIAQGGSSVIYILLGFPQGKIASIFASCMHTEKTRKITLVSERIKLVFDDVQPAHKKIQLLMNGESNHLFIAEENLEPLKRECLHFMECIRENKEPHSGKEDIRFVAKITDYIARSLAKGGEKVTIR
ncbi:hypothetical protein DCMF_20630 [Candidatus Formimonas warabiya]|uniref:Gfo/Idh/MocA-like oxidoreductase N-terminal domain-containing protein n=2 Tax=Formimonas warabiya TaxID=1761012 RepID=A0A3G1KWS4_FORW1|nr:hypothetical protein DCMF_20630 [Candidatus Formimonas warabiya]